MCLVITVVWLFVTPWTIPVSLLCLWNLPGKNTGVGWHFLHHGIKLNPCLLHLLYCRQILYPWATRESPYTYVCVCISFTVINSSTAINIYMCVYIYIHTYMDFLSFRGWDSYFILEGMESFYRHFLFLPVSTELEVKDLFLIGVIQKARNKETKGDYLFSSLWIVSLITMNTH